MDTLSTHYARLLGIDDSWRVDAVDLRLDERREDSPVNEAVQEGDAAEPRAG